MLNREQKFIYYGAGLMLSVFFIISWYQYFVYENSIWVEPSIYLLPLIFLCFSSFKKINALIISSILSIVGFLLGISLITDKNITNSFKILTILAFLVYIFVLLNWTLKVFGTTILDLLELRELYDKTKGKFKKALKISFKLAFWALILYIVGIIIVSMFSWLAGLSLTTLLLVIIVIMIIRK